MGANPFKEQMDISQAFLQPKGYISQWDISLQQHVCLETAELRAIFNQGTYHGCSPATVLVP